MVLVFLCLQRVLVLVAFDVDALCACKILQVRENFCVFIAIAIIDSMIYVHCFAKVI
jgi:hypothetical protein